jgi:hypothetical protein
MNHIDILNDLAAEVTDPRHKAILAELATENARIERLNREQCAGSLFKPLESISGSPTA